MIHDGEHAESHQISAITGLFVLAGPSALVIHPNRRPGYKQPSTNTSKSWAHASEWTRGMR